MHLMYSLLGSFLKNEIFLTSLFLFFDSFLLSSYIHFLISLHAQVCIGLMGVLIIAAAFLAGSKCSYMYGLLWGMMVWWMDRRNWPTSFASAPSFDMDVLPQSTSHTNMLAFSLVFLTILTMFGLTQALCESGGLTKQNGEVPKGRYCMYSAQPSPSPTPSSIYNNAYLKSKTNDLLPSSPSTHCPDISS